MKIGDIVRFNARRRAAWHLGGHAARRGRELYPYKFENGIVIGYFRGGFNDGETVGPNGETALKVVFPSKTGEFRCSCLELVSAAR